MNVKELVIARLTFRQMVNKLLTFAEQNGIQVIIDWTLRDLTTQQNLYLSGKSKTMSSKHLNGLAVDLPVINVEDHAIVKDGTDERYKRLGEFWVDLGGKWGGNFNKFKDSVHFEFDPYEE